MESTVKTKLFCATIALEKLLLCVPGRLGAVIGGSHAAKIFVKITVNMTDAIMRQERHNPTARRTSENNGASNP